MLCITMSHAQNIHVSAPSQVSAGENFRVEYTIQTQDVKNFKIGNIPDGIELIAGPYTSRQSSYQMINGHTTSSSSITYTYTFYAAKKGTYSIEAAQAQVNGRKLTSQNVRISVTGNGGGNTNSQSGRQASRQIQAAGTPITNNDLFIRVSANKKTVHEQEPVLLTYKVYTLVDLTQLNGNMPDLTGFHTQEIKQPQQKTFHIERINNKNYRCVTWSQYVMYPQMTGKLSIPSITFYGVIIQQDNNTDPLEAFLNGGSGYIEVKRNIIAPGLDIDVLPLPAKPADFSGGVGSLNISVQTDKKQVNAGDPINVRVVIGGVGNLKLIKAPDIEFPKGFDKYDVKTTDKTRLTTNGIEGNMIFDYLAVPRNQGKYTIPGVNFTYFDINRKQYQTIKTQPINIHVEKGDGNNAKIEQYNEQDQDIKDITKQNPQVRDIKKIFWGSALYWSIIVVLLIIFALLIKLLKARNAKLSDIDKVKGSKANKIAIKRLKTAEKMMSNNNKEAFYDETQKALWGYVSDKLTIPTEQLNKENIQNKLMEKEIPSVTIDKYIETIDECEFARYAPGDSQGNMKKIYEQAATAIIEIENEMKKKKRNNAKNMHGFLLLMALVCLTLSIPSYATARNYIPITKQQADNEYKRGNYQQAIKDYEMILTKEASPQVYYNLGNAYYRSDYIAKAILNYERAKRLAPQDKAINFNLRYAYNKTIDKIGSPNTMFFITWYHTLVYLTYIDNWAKIGLLALLTGIICFLIYYISHKVFVRKITFAFSLISFLIFICANVFAFMQKKDLKKNHFAIIMSSSIKVRKTPSKDASETFVLHEGTKLQITDRSFKGWYGIKIEDGRKGWIKSEHIEEI